MLTSMKRPQILVAGDSLVGGRFGVDPFSLPDRTGKRSDPDYLIRGMDGDTISGILQRTYRYTILHAPERGILLVGGANDILIPAFAAVNPPQDPRRRLAQNLTRESAEPINDPDSYIGRLREGLLPILTALDQRHIPSDRVGVATIPPLGESRSSIMNRTADTINARIRDLAREVGFTCVELAEGLWEQIHHARERQPQLMSDFCLDDPAVLTEDAVRIREEGAQASIELSASRGLTVTTDGIHWNSLGAAIAAQVFDRFFHAIEP